LFGISALTYEQDVRTAEANVKIAQAHLNSAAMEVNEVRPLAEQDIVSKYELQSAEYLFKSLLCIIKPWAFCSSNQTNYSLSYSDNPFFRGSTSLP
jgi:multidrug resistance efflux pump